MRIPLTSSAHRSGAAAAVAAVLLLAMPAAARMHRPGMEIGPLETATRLVAANQTTNGWGSFDQLIDHCDPALGTFKQRYWYGTEYWKGPGSPIVLVNPGEQSATGFNETYTTDKRLPGRFAHQVGGAVIVLEHRYWGESSPYSVLTTDNMRYLTLNNSLKDMTYFAKTFVPPFDRSGKSAPDKSPWIFSGGSYPGALAGWHAHLEAGTIWAYHGTSSVVQAVSDFWQYFTPVLEATPGNCSKDLQQVIAYVDDVLGHNDDGAKGRLKAKFLLEDLEDVDFVGALESGPWTAQDGQFYKGYNEYYQFCDYIEVSLLRLRACVVVFAPRPSTPHHRPSRG